MKPSLRYDFSEFEKLAEEILSGTANSHTLKSLQNEVNSFFKDSKCKEVLLTRNDDKLFFGMYVIPYITPNDAIEIMQDSDPVRLNQYYLEIDSKLCNPVLNITPKEFVAFLLHDIGHVVNDSKPVDRIRNGVDEYFALNRDNLNISSSVHYQDLLAFGIKNTIQKITSLFEKNSDELFADEFVYEYGYGDDLQSGFEKITKNGFNINGNMSNKFTVMMWILRLYKDVVHKRIPALKALKGSKTLSGSKLEHRELDTAIRRVNHISDDSFYESGVVGKMVDKYSEKMKEIRYKAIRGVEDDFYEYNMRIRNVEDEDDALYLMRQINTRIAIIDDYITTEKLNERDFKKWSKTKDDFEKLREELSKATVYKVKSYGLYVNYPDIKPNRY